MHDSVLDFISLVAIVMATCDVSNAAHIPTRIVKSSPCNHTEIEQIHGEYCGLKISKIKLYIFTPETC